MDLAILQLAYLTAAVHANDMHLQNMRSNVQFPIWSSAALCCLVEHTSIVRLLQHLFS